MTATVGVLNIWREFKGSTPHSPECVEQNSVIKEIFGDEVVTYATSTGLL